MNPVTKSIRFRLLHPVQFDGELTCLMRMTLLWMRRKDIEERHDSNLINLSSDLVAEHERLQQIETSSKVWHNSACLAEM